MRKKRDWDSDSGLNLTPLLDVILNLLFFFILATQIKQGKEILDVNLPKTSQSKTTDVKKDFLIISINNDNIVFVDEEKVETEKLAETLTKIKSERDIKKVIIRGDANAYHQTIVSALDNCAKAGINAISLEVKKNK